VGTLLLAPGCPTMPVPAAPTGTGPSALPEDLTRFLSTRRFQSELFRHPRIGVALMFGIQDFNLRICVESVQLRPFVALHFEPVAGGSLLCAVLPLSSSSGGGGVGYCRRGGGGDGSGRGRGGGGGDGSGPRSQHCCIWTSLMYSQRSVH
jgi:hypothetical protein